jgi:ferredoxin
LSSRTTLSRRDLLGFLRRKEQPAPSPRPAPAPAGGFSLEAFYSARAQAGETTGGQLPVFSLREGLVVPQDGVSRLGLAPLVPPPTVQTPETRRGPPPVGGMTVRVRPQLCLSWQGSFCSTCSERCPVEDAIVVESGRPRVVEERCNGCGLCVQMCPAPLNALELLPARPSQVSAPCPKVSAP